MAAHWRILRSLVLVATATAGCRHAPAADGPHVQLILSPLHPVVDQPVHAVVHLVDAARQPIAHARIELEAHMEHPGMAPVIASAPERAPGVYASDLRLPMAGDWILMVSGSLDDGRRIREEAGHASARAAD
jgi:hypothetical protein